MRNEDRGFGGRYNFRRDRRARISSEHKSIELQPEIAVRVETKEIHLFRGVEQIEQSDCTGKHQNVDQAV